MPSSVPMIRIHVLYSRAPGVERTIRIRVLWQGQELTVTAEEVRRTALALHRAVWWHETRRRLVGRGMAEEQATETLGPLPPGADGEFQISIGPSDSIRFARAGVRARIAVADASTMATGWLRVAESADTDGHLVAALRHATDLSPTQVDDLFAYLRILRSDDPATELGD
jgi:hypothetical protein